MQIGRVLQRIPYGGHIDAQATSNSIPDPDSVCAAVDTTQNSIPSMAPVELGSRFARESFRWLGIVRSDDPLCHRGCTVLYRVKPAVPTAELIALKVKTA